MKPVLLFDLDNTLLDFDWAEQRALKRTFADFGLDMTEEMLLRYSEINRACWEKLEQGEMSREMVRVSRFEELFAEYGLSLSGEAVEERYEKYVGEGHRFVPGAEELLEKLKDAYALYIVSNGFASVQEGRLKSAGISHYFQEIFISELLGHDKPSRAFFELCFAKIPQYEQRQIMIIGDSLTSDIQGGINAKISTCWFNPKGQPVNGKIPAEYRIQSLSELPAVLDSWQNAQKSK